IRVFHVTGVQTCALPISPDWQSVQIDKSQNAVVIRDELGDVRAAFGNIQGYPWGSGVLGPDTYGMHGDRAGVYMRGYARLLGWRSEERRVGKAGRSRRPA